MWPAALTYALAKAGDRDALNRGRETTRRARTRERRSRTSGSDDLT